MQRVEWGRVVMRPDDQIDTSWMADAACKDHPIDLFFFDERVDRERLKDARAVCGPCPVWRQCLTYAIEIPVDFGIWGGFTPRERERKRVQARRPRPRQRSRGRPL